MEKRKKILYISSATILLYPKSIENSFVKLGYEVISCDEKEIISSYTQQQVQHIIDTEHANYMDILESNSIEFVFTVNVRSLKNDFFEYCRSKNIPIYQYLVDSIKWYPKYLKDMCYYTDIFSYEPSDVNVEFKPGQFVKYLPFACDVGIYKPLQSTEKKYDLFFVGNLDIRRWELLERIAKNANEKGYRMVVYTGMQIKKITSLRHIFKILLRRIRYTLRYPNLMKVVQEEMHVGADLTKLYNESKICLNIHVGKDDGMHTGPNLRTFEILGCGSFELIDRGHLLGTEYVPDEDIVETTDDEWNKKIDYYLSHNEEREKIAMNGHQKTVEFHTMDHLIKKILKEIDMEN